MSQLMLTATAAYSGGPREDQPSATGAGRGSTANAEPRALSDRPASAPSRGFSQSATARRIHRVDLSETDTRKPRSNADRIDGHPTALAI